MSRAVLLSVQPRWCELIASGKKTVEVRKTKPKLETPFKVYIYCTKGKFDPSECLRNNLHYDDSTIKVCDGIGKVIGEFVCDCIVSHCEMANADIAEQQGCIKREQLFEYANGKELYGWHISDLAIYDEPRTLGEFFHACNKPRYTDCSVCIDHRAISCTEITCPPQSWCYVEEAQDG